MLTKTGIHAIRAIAALSEQEEGRYSGAGLIARQIGAPQNYLGKLLQTLSHEGILVSQKGLNGGFRLAKDADCISLLDIVDPIEHISKRTGCILGKESCSNENPCPLHEKWVMIRDQYIELLENTMVSDIVNDPKKFLAAKE